MKRYPFILLTITAGLLLMQQSIAQKAKAKEEKKPAEKAAAVTLMQIVLGRTNLSSGQISKQMFDSAGRDGIRVKEPGATIAGFTFMYGERNLYEDSVGNPLIKTDYLTEYCFGDTLTAAIRDNIFTRTKAGDTVYYDEIKVKLASGTETRGKSMKFVLTK